MTTSIIRDRDDMPIQVGREVDVYGTVAADSPDVVLQVGNPTGRGAEVYLTPARPAPSPTPSSPPPRTTPVW